MTCKPPPPPHPRQGPSGHVECPEGTEPSSGGERPSLRCTRTTSHEEGGGGMHILPPRVLFPELCPAVAVWAARHAPLPGAQSEGGGEEGWPGHSSDQVDLVKSTGRTGAPVWVASTEEGVAVGGAGARLLVRTCHHWGGSCGGVGGSTPPPTTPGPPPFNIYGPNFLTSLRPSQNLLWCLRCQLV